MMESQAIDFWTDHTSVLFTSFYGWAPEAWAAVGFTGDRGRTRRDNLLSRMTDPFIVVGYVTGNSPHADPDIKGKVAGFYLASHQIGDRDKFTHPSLHSLNPESWRHSALTLRAFSYLPEYRLKASELGLDLTSRGRSVAAMGLELNDPVLIERLRSTPWVEVDMFQPGVPSGDEPLESRDVGFVPAGPSNARGYVVSPSAAALDRQLYVLRLTGDTNAFLGENANGRLIYKIGLAISPRLRLSSFEKSLPSGAFHWELDRTTRGAGLPACRTFEAAVAGEDAMKRHLAKTGKHLGGEFYLASGAEIDAAWQSGHAAVAAFVGGD